MILGSVDEALNAMLDAEAEPDFAVLSASTCCLAKK